MTDISYPGVKLGRILPHLRPATATSTFGSGTRSTTFCTSEQYLAAVTFATRSISVAQNAWKPICLHVPDSTKQASSALHSPSYFSKGLLCDGRRKEKSEGKVMNCKAWYLRISNLTTAHITGSRLINSTINSWPTKPVRLLVQASNSSTTNKEYMSTSILQSCTAVDDQTQISPVS